MSGPLKAEIDVLDRNGKATETIKVQFNPASMTLQMSNSNDGAESRGRQRQQYNGSASTTLSVDLEFDTADEGTSSRPVDVRDRTAMIRQFVLPGGKESKSAPPRLCFRWGTFEITGVMDSLSEELSYFSSDGVPLRAKLTVQVKEQDSRFEALETGPGANRANGAPAAGEDAKPGGPLDRLANALAGETPADFLARNGLAPEAWRALGGALDALGDGIELEAGVSVGFSAGLSAGGGLGVSAGFGAGLGVSLGGSLGLTAGAAAGGSASGGTTSQGLALAAAGGLSAASETALTTEAVTSADTTRRQFGTTPTPPSTGADPSRAPLATVPSARSLPPTAAAAAPSPPRADRRATSFGRGVPLRDRITVPGAVADSWIVVGGKTVSSDRATDPWSTLPASDDRTAADHEQSRRGGSCGCRSCGGPR